MFTPHEVIRGAGHMSSVRLGPMTTTKMKAIVQTDPQERRSLELQEVEVPQLQSGEVLVKVQAAGVNRGDILQTMGAYPPPPGASEILGLEAAGTIADAGVPVIIHCGSGPAPGVHTGPDQVHN